MRFLKKVCRHEGGGHLQIMYGIDGRRDLVERQLDHLTGYQGSRPGAGRQRRGGPAPARRLRRGAGDRRHLAPQPRDDRRHLARAARPGGLGQQELAPARLQHLGGPGRGAALRVQQGDELGRARSRRPDGRGARAGVERRRVAGRSATRCTPRSWSGGGASGTSRSPRPTTTTRSTRRRWRFRWCGSSRGTTRGSTGPCARSPASSPAPTASWCTATSTRMGWRGRRGRSRSAPSGWRRP